MRRGPSEPCLSVVLPAGTRRCGARPFDLLEEPARTLPGERSAAQGVRDDRGAVHHRGTGFAVDASMIKADANRQRSVPGSEWQAPETASCLVPAFYG